MSSKVSMSLKAKVVFSTLLMEVSFVQHFCRRSDTRHAAQGLGDESAVLRAVTSNVTEIFDGKVAA